MDGVPSDIRCGHGREVEDCQTCSSEPMSIGIGTRVSYEDMANPLREGTIVGEIAGQWAVIWDREIACASCGSENLLMGVDDHDEEDGTYECEDCGRKGIAFAIIDGLKFHETVTKHMLAHAVARNGLKRVAGWNAANDAGQKFDADPVVGEVASGFSYGPGYYTRWSGIYRGIVASEWDGKPMHFFTDGILGQTPQTSFGHPAEGENLTTDMSPSQIFGAR